MIVHILREDNYWIFSIGSKIKLFLIEMLDIFFGILQRVGSEFYFKMIALLLQAKKVRFGEVMNC
jgi:hypothetical protein